ncbi:serine hydrolase domain-containing protein [Stenotrophomonas terrae]|uniref:serine hydrolase domain-containing protein n=1 Tax=Stenotrophomonas terrae TaxID=405446 RepID=UPI00070C0E83|nr:serine hydrolase domain-containing protein [Stenotrophomonas terrae]
MFRRSTHTTSAAHRTTSSRFTRRLLLAACACVVGISSAHATSNERWQRLDNFLAQSTSNNGYPGAVALVEVNGRTQFHGQWGHADIARSRPMREDSIFRIYSMTKPVTSTAILMLLEQGKLSLDDPLSRFIPAFADRQIVTGGDAAYPLLAPAPRAITLRHLLTHTSGFAADSDGHAVATALLNRADVDSATSLEDVAARLATLPLADAPGTHFHYEGSNTELLARVVEIVSGQPFAQFLAQHIFQPLGMSETGFEVAVGQRARVVDLPTSAADGTLHIADTLSARSPGVRLKGYDSGAGGLYSTAADYLKFARMLLGNGESNGARLLSRKTVELMMSDQLGGFTPAIKGFSDGEGFGLGGYVVTDPALRGRLGSVGQFGWSGAASTYFTVDRSEQLIAIVLLQYLPEGDKRLPSLATPFYNLVYQAIP